MLQKNWRALIEAKSFVDEKHAATFRALIDANNPENVAFTKQYVDQALCKENRTVIRADEAEFEDYAYSIQDTLLSTTITK